MEKPHPKFRPEYATASHCFILNQVTKLSTYSDVFIGVACACACACDDWHGHLSSEKQRAHTTHTHKLRTKSDENQWFDAHKHT